jgi:hypothetical protein
MFVIGFASTHFVKYSPNYFGEGVVSLRWS